MRMLGKDIGIILLEPRPSFKPPSLHLPKPQAAIHNRTRTACNTREYRVFATRPVLQTPPSALVTLSAYLIPRSPASNHMCTCVSRRVGPIPLPIQCRQLPSPALQVKIGCSTVAVLCIPRCPVRVCAASLARNDRCLATNLDHPSSCGHSTPSQVLIFQHSDPHELSEQA